MHIAQKQKVKRKINLLYCKLKNVKINYHVVFLRKVWVDMFGGSWMDTFMDKLAQKFTAQEMIKANSAAEAAELQRIRDQVKKYNDCLQEMKQVNDDTKAALAQIKGTLATGMDQFKSVELPIDELSTLVDCCLGKVEHLQESTAGIQENLNQHMDSISSDIMDFVHKENVKVYRNVQAVIVDELKKQDEALSAKLDAMSKTQRTTRNFAISAMIFALLSAAALAAQLLIQFGIFNI